MLESSVMLFADRICTAPPTRVANSGAGVPASRALPIPSTSLHTYTPSLEQPAHPAHRQPSGCGADATDDDLPLYSVQDSKKER